MTELLKKHIIGIVGPEAAKFTRETERGARRIIRRLLIDAFALCSGHCHLGGVDIFAEEEAVAMGVRMLIFPPAAQEWSAYKQRNLAIARCSDEVYCITVRELPPGFKGMRFARCYHCGTDKHVKSGGCWTVKQAKEMGKVGSVIVL